MVLSDCCIEIFFFQEGKFAIPIHAVLPEFGVEVPADIQFNMCATEDTIRLSFDIKNTRCVQKKLAGSEKQIGCVS